MNYFVWDASPVLLNLGPVAIRWYGLLFALGFIIGYEIFSWIYKIEGKKQKDLDNFTVVMILSTVIGARLGHCFFYEPAYYLSHPAEIIAVWKGGLASHGAAIGILLGIWIYTRYKKDYQFLWILDRLVIAVALAGSLIRLGNFFNSEILGMPSNVPWAVIFAKVDMVPRHPAQLYESISYLIIFLVLIFIYKKYKQNVPEGRLFGIFLTFVFGARFVIEYFKERQSDLELNMFLHLGQLLSIPFIIAGVYFWYRSYKIKPTKT
ncbi:MAG: prolipoprotein diacylglyceryl transferase [Candidatus Kapaibacteriota bacterium]